MVRERAGSVITPTGNGLIIRGRQFGRRLIAGLVCCAPLFFPGRVLPQTPRSGVVAKIDFNKGLPEGSRAIAGKWETAGGRLRQGARTGPALVFLAKPPWNQPYTAKVRVRLPKGRAGSESGLVLHARDPKNFVAFSLQQKKGGPYAVLRIEVDPGTKMVGDEARLKVDLDRWHELRVDVVGPHFSGYLDGKPCVNFSFLGTPPPAHVNDPKLWPDDPTHGQVGLLTRDAEAEFEGLEISRKSDYSDIVTPQLARRDARGRLLPRQSYAETMKRFTEWLLRSSEVVDQSSLPAPLRGLEPYIVSNWILSDDKTHLGDEEFAINHALLISGAVRYYVFAGDKRALDMAGKVADWHIANSTLKSSAAPYLPPSFVSWQPDGTWKGQEWGLELDKSALMGISYLKLYSCTGKKKYKTAALRIADTLQKLQQADGSWPFRVDPKTGKVKHGYSESQLWYVKFYERVAALTGDKGYLTMRDRAFRWLLDNPVKTNRWLNLYGDVASGTKSYDQWIPLETVMYLLKRRNDNPAYLAKAKGIMDWVNRTLVVNPGLHAGVPGIVEQSMYRVVLTHHELRLAEANAKLWEATGERRYRDLAEQIANSVTWCLMSDGKFRLGLGSHAQSIPLVLPFNDHYCEIMAAIPRTAPKGENHLLRSGSDVRRITYGKDQIAYLTAGASHDRLRVVGEPKAVTAGGKSLVHLTKAGDEQEGWFYDPGTQELRIRHRHPEVSIRFP